MHQEVQTSQQQYDGPQQQQRTINQFHISEAFNKNLRNTLINRHAEMASQDMSKQIKEQKQIKQESERQMSNEQQQQPYNNHITINEECVNQMVTVLIEPSKSIWYRGQIIASNRPYSFEERPRGEGIDFERFMHYFKLKWKVPLKLINNGPDMAYFCIRKRGGGGKILYLQQSVYNQLFTIDLSKVLTINCDPLDFTVDTVKYLPYLSNLNFKQKLYDVSITLQANLGNMIYQKSLGAREKLYIGNSYVIAMSNTILVSKVENNICLEGPGYVFLEGPSSPAQYQNVHNLLLLKIFTITVLVTIFLLLTT